MRALLIFALLFTGAAFAQSTPLVLYDNSLNAGFQDWSWGTHTLNNATPVHAGSASISFLPRNWEGLLFASPGGAYDIASYQSLTFWVHGGSSGGQSMRVSIISGSSNLADLPIATYTAGGAVVANAWRLVTIPFDATTGLTSGTFDRFQIQDFTGGATQGTAYFDDIVFNPRTTPLPSGQQTVSVDLNAGRHPINPGIYGVSAGDAARNQAIGYTVVRWGGNSVTRYNWQGHADNKGSDWFYLGYPDATDADTFIDQVRAGGAQPLITIPTIGWTPINDGARHWGFSVAKYGPQLQTEYTYTGGQFWANPDAGSGECNPNVNHTAYCVADSPGATHGLIKGNDPHDTSIAAPPAFEAQWVGHIQSRVGTAANGGVKYYALDNESMLWHSTHRDVHPAPPTYDEIWQKAVDYGAAIKAQDPGAQIFGPVTWGYCDQYTDAADAARGPSCIDGIDRQAHGGVPFVKWYLKQVCDYQAAHGVRLVDYLDVHIYPEGDNGHDLAGTGSTDESAATSAWRLRALKELYDPNYLQESWVGDRPNYIPRLKSWIAASCPGIKLAITEYKWGGDNGASGALAQAEALAIFGREGVDVANRWTAPVADSYAEDAFTMYLNYDGTHTRIDGDSVAATSSDVNALGAYAVHKAGQHVYVLLFNKSTSAQDISITLSSALNGPWRNYRFDGSHHLAQVGSGTIAGNALTVTAIPARSSTLLVLPDVGVANDAMFLDSFE